MADFRKLLPALAMIALIAVFSVPASAQIGSAFTCVNNAGVPPTVRAEGITELTGDLVLNCSGTAGIVPPAGIVANVQIFLNTNVTSRIINTTTNELDALLILNEDVASAKTGTLAGSNSVVWLGVNVLGAGSTSSIIRITNVRANASGVTSINPNLPSSLIPAQIVAFISISGSTSVPVNNPQQIVAFAQQGLIASAGSETLKQCQSLNAPSTATPTESIVTLTYTEGFATSFKQKIASNQSPSATGVNYNSETGFLLASNPAVGVADNATGLQAAFENIPAGATVLVTNTNTNASPTIGATLVGATGAGWTALTATGNAATAVWRINVLDPVTQEPLSPFTLESLEFGVALSYTADPANNVPGTSPPAMTVRMNFSPLSTVTTASSTAPIPRFIDASAAKNVFTVNACVTNLLFPYVTTAPGFDTGIAISNTSLDSPAFSTSAQTGACTLYFFGAGAPTTAPVTPSVTPGTVFAFSTWSGSGTEVPALQDFSGYLIARCTFQYAHGFAFISDLGTQQFAQGYLALVIPDRGGDRPADPFTTAGTGSGEQLGY